MVVQQKTAMKFFRKADGIQKRQPNLGLESHTGWMATTNKFLYFMNRIQLWNDENPLGN